VALELMRRGFLHVHPLIGGIDAWRANSSVGSTRLGAEHAKPVRGEPEE
jgi:hypothetical protein